MVQVEIARKSKLWKRLDSLLKRTVASISSLSNRFYSIFKINPANSEAACKYTGLFGFEELKEPKDFDALLKDSFKKVEMIMLEIRKEDPNCNIIMLCDDLLHTLYKVENLSAFVKSRHPQKEFAEAAERVHSEVERRIGELYRDKEFHFLLKKAAKVKLDESNKESVGACFIGKVLHRLASYSLSDEEKRKKIFDLNKQLSEIKIPRQKRKKWWQKSTNYSNDFCTILIKRSQIAYYQGYSSYADYALRHSVAMRPDFVKSFLSYLREEIKFQLYKDIKEIEQDNEFKYSMSELESQDLSSLIFKSKKKILDINSHVVKSYFSFDACMDGLKLILRSLYNVSLEIVEDADIVTGELWSTDIKKICVREETEILGYIYCDIFKRPERSHHKYFLVQSGRVWANGTYQRPIVVISLQLPNSATSKPILLNIYDVDALFRKMGQAMHFIFRETKYHMIREDKCAPDLIDVHCSLMELYASDSRIIKQFAMHYETKEVIPDSLIEKILHYRKKFAAYNIQLKGFDASLDQECSSNGGHESFSTLFRRIWLDYFCALSHPTKHQKHKYMRLVYAKQATVYSHLMSKAIASMIWQKYLKDDPLSLTAGKHYREEFLVKSKLFRYARPIVEDYLKIQLTYFCLADALLDNMQIPRMIP